LVSLECTGIIVVPSFRCARFVACPVSEWAFHFVGMFSGLAWASEYNLRCCY
jgi:hypothetical protein